MTGPSAGEGLPPAWSPGRRFAAAGIVVAFGALSLMAGAGFLIAGCWEDCSPRDRILHVLLALGVAVFVAALGVVGVRAARRSWRALGYFVVGVLAAERVIEFWSDHR